MKVVKSESPEKFKDQFKFWIETLKNANCKTVEELVTKIIGAVMNSKTSHIPKKRVKPNMKREGNVVHVGEKKYLRCVKISSEERKRRINEKISNAQAK